MPASSRKTTVLTLPKPGQQYKDDDKIETEIYDITKQTTVNMLKDRLEKYGLPRDGKRDVLIGRLEEFACDRTAWRSLFQPLSKRKRGSRSGKRKESHSAKRVSAMFDSDNDQPLPHQYQFEGTHRPVQSQTQFQEMQLDDWTDCALRDCGDGKWEEAMMLANSSHPVAEEELFNDREYSAKATMRRMLHQLKDIHQAISGGKILAMGPNVSGLPVIAPPMPAHVIPPPLPQLLMPFASPIPHGTEVPTTLPPTVPAPVPDHSLSATTDWEAALPDSVQVPGGHMVTLQLENGPLTFDQREIPDPPAQHFSNHISKLFSEWEAGTLLQISGQYIPLKDWPKIYKARAGGRRGVWDALKVEFANWKFLVEEKERLGSEDAFWAVYSKNGSRLRYQHILNHLKRARAVRNRADADAARKYFGGDLRRADTNGAFRYVKKGRASVYSKDQAVADAWRQLLARDPDVAAGWERMEAMEITNLLTSLDIPLTGLAAAK